MYICGNIGITWTYADFFSIAPVYSNFSIFNQESMS